MLRRSSNRTPAKNRFFSKILIDWDKSWTRQEYLANRRYSVGNEPRRRFRGYFVLLVALGILLVGLGSQHAIAQTERASVSGRVTDQSNAAIADAEVQIRNIDTGATTIAKT